MKIVLDYEVSTGGIIDPTSGISLGCLMGLDHHELKTNIGVDIESIVKLKNAGFTADEIIELKRKEVL